MSAQSKRQTRFQRRLSLEKLDDRLLMSVSPPQAVTVESYNLYAGSGFDLEKALANPSAFLATLSGSPDAQIAARTQQWKDIQATKFNERADAIAKQIVANKPDLIGLQEVWTYYTGIPDGKATQATKEELNFLKVLQAKLAAKGLPYEVQAQVTEHDSEGPAYINGVLRDLRERAACDPGPRGPGEPVGRAVHQPPREEVRGQSRFSVSPYPGNYGWTSIDVNWGGSKFRFVNMCLDIPIFPVTQAFQAAEIVTAGPAATTLPVILVGDSNTDGNIYPAYQILVGGVQRRVGPDPSRGPGLYLRQQTRLEEQLAMSYLPHAHGLDPPPRPVQGDEHGSAGRAREDRVGPVAVGPRRGCGKTGRNLAVGQEHRPAGPSRRVAVERSGGVAQVTDAGSRIVPDSPQSRPDPIATPSNRRFDFGGPAGKARPKTSVVIDRLMADDASVLRPQADVDS